ncbi:MAG: 30S ribosomal protein S12 methylthiotransferase RimO [Phycisphaerae bacterium]|nr:30S ribosomal protein S12 methylthiotransferase RimO [Phycisphaerae bacterium]
MAGKKTSTVKSLNSKIQSVAFVSLGCPKNLVDSEKMLGLLAEDGIAITPDHDQADAIVINTCGFLEASKTESLEVIREAVEEKQRAGKTGRKKRVIVAGCLVQRHRAKLLDQIPEIDALVGVFDRENIVTAVRGDGGAGAGADLGTFHPISAFISKHDRSQVGYTENDQARLRLTPRHYAYLRVSEGCNQGCTFCTIPSIRGRMRSKPLSVILAEAKELIADGAFEINLIGQDTTSYGQDIGYAGPGQGLAGLIRSLNGVADIGWIRLMYAYPSCFTDEMVGAIADAKNMVKYIDMPLQHINDQILHAMRRKVTRKQIETLLGKLRDRIPGITLRTTLISGFPGETEAQHRELLEFVRDFAFDCLGVFEFSPEPGTPAQRLHTTDAVPTAVMARRKDEIMAAQQQVAFAKNRHMVGRTLNVLVDQVGRRGSMAMARHAGQAPEIDSRVLLRGGAAVPGELMSVVVEDWQDYDLIARPTQRAVRENGTRPGRGQVSLPVLAGHR